MSRVHIVYTNGITAFKVYWISQNGKDIYHGFHLKNKRDIHLSHHKDGKYHLKIDGKKLPFSNRLPVTEIKGIYNLLNFNAGDTIEWMPRYFPFYKNEKLKNIVWIDTRLFSNDSQIQTELYLIKPESISYLSSKQFRKINEKDYRLIQIIQDINPWLIIHTRNLKPI